MLGKAWAQVSGIVISQDDTYQILSVALQSTIYFWLEANFDFAETLAQPED